MVAGSRRPPIPVVEGRPLKGVVLVVLATLAFALGDTATKYLAERHPVPVVLAVRYLVNLGLMALVLYPRVGPALWRVQRGLAVFLRGLCLALASLTMGFALRLMPVGETVAIIYLAPFAVMMLSAPLLGERVPPAGWIWAAAGFAGVLVILRPGGGLDPWGVTFALVNAGFATAYHLMTRLLSRTESTMAMLFHTALVGSVIFGVMAVPSLDGLRLGAADAVLMIALGAAATLGHFLFTSAYREAPAGLLAPVNYIHLVWAGGLGFVIFGHLPDAASLLGMALVCLSGVAIAVTVRR
jgi:drug/metabolite transporter (DMT)-like permease